MNKATCIIKSQQIENIFDMNDYVSTIEMAFNLYGEGNVHMPSKVYLFFDKGDLRCMPVYIPSMKIAGVKNVNVHPGNRELPAVMASITLFDPETGFPLAIMDGTHITKMRTGAAGGVAAKYLSRNDSRIAAFIGAGDQAETQLKALLVTRPELSEIIVYDISKERMEGFAKTANKDHGMNARHAASVNDAVSSADIVVTTTPVRTPVVKAEYIRSGTHINAIGADAPGKQELDGDILKQARVIIDNWEQASHSGEINAALSKEIITREDIYGDIGEIVTGKKPGRDSLDQITVFDSTGLAVQDISSAVEIYRRLLGDKKQKSKLEKVALF